MTELELRILSRMEETERKAWFSLAGYKFWMAGYHMAAWVRDNHLLKEPLPNPFKDIVDYAKGLKSRVELLKGGH